MNPRKHREAPRAQDCPQCGMSFMAWVSKPRRYCSKVCYDVAQQVPKTTFKMRKGYRVIYVGREHPMADGDGNCYEHRLVMAAHLGRPLARREHIHHDNENRIDNRIENLVLTDASAHMAHHRRVDGWAKHHDSCVRCGGTARPHAGGGLCRLCYSREYHG